MKDPVAVAGKWVTNLTGSVNQIKAGVQSVTVSPTAKAARQADAYVAGVQAAVASGKWQASLNSVSLQDWQQAMLTKGVPRISTGAVAAKGKVEAFMSKWLPFEQAGVDRLAAMPRGNLAQNLARMVAMAEYNASFKKF